MSDATTLTDATMDVPAIPENLAARRLRINELLRQRECIDRELAWLNLEFSEDGARSYKCKRCPHEWRSTMRNIPRTCPRCRSPYWQIARPGDGKKRVVRAPGPDKRRVGRPSKAEIRAELDAARKKYEETFGPIPYLPPMPIQSVDVMAELDKANPLSTLPPPPPLAVRHVPTEPLLDQPIDEPDTIAELEDDDDAEPPEEPTDAV